MSSVARGQRMKASARPPVIRQMPFSALARIFSSATGEPGAVQKHGGVDLVDRKGIRVHPRGPRLHEDLAGDAAGLEKAHLQN
jgi:hypothetical protein